MEATKLMSVKQAMFPKVWSTSQFGSNITNCQSVIVDNRFKLKFNHAHKRVKLIKEAKGLVKHNYVSSLEYHWLKMNEKSKLKKLNGMSFSKGEFFVPWSRIEKIFVNLYEKCKI